MIGGPQIMAKHRAFGADRGVEAAVAVKHQDGKSFLGLRALRRDAGVGRFPGAQLVRRWSWARGPIVENRAGGGHRRRPQMAMAAGCGALVVVVAATCGIEGEVPHERVRAEQFGDSWPLTVKSGLLSCEVGGEITFQAHRTEYSVMLPARGSAYTDISSLRATAADGRTKKDLAPLIERGRRLCR